MFGGGHANLLEGASGEVQRVAGGSPVRGRPASPPARPGARRRAAAAGPAPGAPAGPAARDQLAGNRRGAAGQRQHGLGARQVRRSGPRAVGHRASRASSSAARASATRPRAASASTRAQQPPTPRRPRQTGGHEAVAALRVARQRGLAGCRRGGPGRLRRRPPSPAPPARPTAGQGGRAVQRAPRRGEVTDRDQQVGRVHQSRQQLGGRAQAPQLAHGARRRGQRLAVEPFVDQQAAQVQRDGRQRVNVIGRRCALVRGRGRRRAQRGCRRPTGPAARPDRARRVSPSFARADARQAAAASRSPR